MLLEKLKNKTLQTLKASDSFGKSIWYRLCLSR